MFVVFVRLEVGCRCLLSYWLQSVVSSSNHRCQHNAISRNNRCCNDPNTVQERESGRKGKAKFLFHQINCVKMLLFTHFFVHCVYLYSLSVSLCAYLYILCIRGVLPVPSPYETGTKQILSTVYLPCIYRVSTVYQPCIYRVSTVVVWGQTAD